MAFYASEDDLSSGLARRAMTARWAMVARWAMQARRAMQSPGYQVEAPAGLARVRLRRPAGPCTW